MKPNPLQQLTALGQSIWLDYIKRDLISSGELKKLIAEDGLRGLTSNPAIFEKAFATGDEYQADIQAMAQTGQDANTIYEALTRQDVQAAADVFRELYDKTEGRQGYVSLEVNPHLAHDTQATIEETRRLWQALDRPNVLIKIPATREGLPAITHLISEGININVTLLFGLPRYQAVADAYIAGLEQRSAAGKPIDTIASVASFFISRIDALTDPLLEKYIAHNGELLEIARKLHGQVAITSAKIAYQMYNEIFSSERFELLAEQGARSQQLLWASTSTKNPAYSDIKYVEALIGVETINTMPVETLNAYRDHGDPELQLNVNAIELIEAFHQLPALNIGIDQVTQQLEREGVEKFNQAFDQLMITLTQTLLQQNTRRIL